MRRVFDKFFTNVVDQVTRFTNKVFIQKLEVGEFNHGLPMEKFQLAKKTGYMKGDGTIQGHFGSKEWDSQPSIRYVQGDTVVVSGMSLYCNRDFITSEGMTTHQMLTAGYFTNNSQSNTMGSRSVLTLGNGNYNGVSSANQTSLQSWSMQWNWPNLTLVDNNKGICCPPGYYMVTLSGSVAFGVAAGDGRYVDVSINAQNGGSLYGQTSVRISNNTGTQGQQPFHITCFYQPSFNEPLYDMTQWFYTQIAGSQDYGTMTNAILDIQRFY